MFMSLCGFFWILSRHWVELLTLPTGSPTWSTRGAKRAKQIRFDLNDAIYIFRMWLYMCFQQSRCLWRSKHLGWILNVSANQGINSWSSKVVAKVAFAFRYHAFLKDDCGKALFAVLAAFGPGLSSSVLDGLESGTIWNLVLLPGPAIAGFSYIAPCLWTFWDFVMYHSITQ